MHATEFDNILLYTDANILRDAEKVDHGSEQPFTDIAHLIFHLAFSQPDAGMHATGSNAEV